MLRSKGRFLLGLGLLILLLAAASLATAVAAPDFLTFIERQKDGVGGVDGLEVPSWVAISPDGAHVYVASFGKGPPFGDTGSVAVFSRNAATGKLTFVEAKFDNTGGVDGIDSAASVAVSPDGKHVYVAGRGDDAVAAFSRNAATGALTFVEVLKDGGTDGQGNTIDGLAGANFVAVSPDGKHVYATGFDEDAVAVFSRNAATGKLTFVEAKFEGVGGVNGLVAPLAVAVSPDGKHVYVDGLDDNAVAVFSRNAATGKLTFVEWLKDGGTDGQGNAIDGLAGATSVTVSPDNTCVYVAGLNDDAVAVFGRNAATGKLTFVEVQKDAVSGVDGLDGARAVTVSPDRVHVYVAGSLANAVAVFSRNVATCRLTFIEVQKDGVGDVEGLQRAVSVTASPDKGHVYVAGADADAVVVFSTPPQPVPRPVGGYGEPLSVLVLLMPWLVLVTTVAMGAVGAVVFRRRMV